MLTLLLFYWNDSKKLRYLTKQLKKTPTAIKDKLSLIWKNVELHQNNWCSSMFRSKLNQNENFFEHKLIPSLHWVHTKKSTMAAVVSSEKKFQLYYFPLKAKGLGVALIAQFSGLPWDGPASLNYDVRKNWKELKSSGDCVFGQLPYLKTAQGVGINQTTAIVQYISKLAGSTLEGANEEDWIMNQMLIAEAEDLYTALQKYQPTLYVSLGRPDRFKADLEGHRFYWATWVPKQFKMISAVLCLGASYDNLRSCSNPSTMYGMR